jgi:hypothetical protein
MTCAPLNAESDAACSVGVRTVYAAIRSAADLTSLRLTGRVIVFDYDMRVAFPGSDGTARMLAAVADSAKVDDPGPAAVSSTT